MVKNISKDNMLKMAEDIAEYVEKNHELPTKLTYDGTNFFILEYAYVMSYGVFHLKSSFQVPNFSKAENPNGDTLNENIVKDDYMDMAKRVYNYILKNKRVPNNVKTRAGKKADIRLYIYAIAKCIRFYRKNGHLASNVQFDSSAFVKPQPKPQPKSYSEEIFDYFCELFGKPSCIDDALEKIQGCGYGYYYNDKLTNKQTLKGLATRGGTKPNCTDIHQAFWHIGIVMGYEVRAVHVMCRGGDGHIRLDFNKGNGFFSRDASAVADGECVECIWCSNGTVVAYNPYWFTKDLYK